MGKPNKVNAEDILLAALTAMCRTIVERPEDDCSIENNAIWLAESLTTVVDGPAPATPPSTGYEHRVVRVHGVE